MFVSIDTGYRTVCQTFDIRAVPIHDIKPPFIICIGKIDLILLLTKQAVIIEVSGRIANQIFRIGMQIISVCLIDKKATKLESQNSKYQNQFYFV